MKKLMFLSMMIGSMLLFSGVASAQQFTGTVWAVNGSGKVTPEIGDKITVAIYPPRHSEPEKGLVSGRKYVVINFWKGQGGGQSALVNLDVTPYQGDPVGKLSTTKVTKLANPVPGIINKDKVTWDLKTKTFTFSRGKTVFGKITHQ